MAQIKPIEKQVDELVRKLSLLRDKGIDVAVVQALNKTLGPSLTETRSALAKKTKVPSKILGRRFRTRKASVRKPEARIWMGTRGITAISLPGVKDTGRLVRDKRGRYAGRKGRGVVARGGFQYPDSWIGRSSQNNTRQVMTSKTPGPNSKGKYKVEREEVHEHFEEIANKVIAGQMREKFPLRLQQALAYQIHKLKAK